MSEIREQVNSVDNIGAFCPGSRSLPRWFAVYTTASARKACLRNTGGAPDRNLPAALSGDPAMARRAVR